MGLLDILSSIQTGGGLPGAPTTRPGQAPASQSQGMSPIAKALLALLATYGVKHMRREGSPATQPGQPRGGTITAGNPGGGGGLGDLLGSVLGGGRSAGAPAGKPSGGGGLDDLLGSVLGGGRSAAPAGGSGGLGDLLRGPLGGVLGGAAAGTVVSGGLDELLKQFQQSGQSAAARSWVGKGPNDAISQDDLASALGADTLDQLAGHVGMGRRDLLAGLSQELPGFIDQLTPDGRLPTEEEAGRWV